MTKCNKSVGNVGDNKISMNEGKHYSLGSQQNSDIVPMVNKLSDQEIKLNNAFNDYAQSLESESIKFDEDLLNDSFKLDDNIF
jgi:hypothetical protein